MGLSSVIYSKCLLLLPCRVSGGWDIGGCRRALVSLLLLWGLLYWITSKGCVTCGSICLRCHPGLLNRKLWFLSLCSWNISLCPSTFGHSPHLALWENFPASLDCARCAMSCLYTTWPFYGYHVANWHFLLLITGGNY